MLWLSMVCKKTTETMQGLQ